MSSFNSPRTKHTIGHGDIMDCDVPLEKDKTDQMIFRVLTIDLILQSFVFMSKLGYIT